MSAGPPPSIRPATDADLAQVAAIYAELVETTHVIFELVAPPLSSWQRRLSELDARDGFLVAIDAAGAVLGFGYSSPYRPKPAYAGSRETTIHLAPQARGRGLGRSLYAELLADVAARGNRLAVAVVAEPNEASTRLHQGLGFAAVGTIPDVGEKLGRLWSTTIWAKRL